MDLSESIIPRSDQLNSDDLMAGPATVTIAAVKRGNAEQPVDIVTEEFGTGRPYKPSKSMRRVMVAAWGTDGSTYVGHRLTLYREPTIRFGKDEVGGIRISHMSGIDKPLRLALTVKRGQRDPFVVQPIPAGVPSRDWAAEVAAATSDAELMALWGQSPKTPDIKALVAARHDEFVAAEGGAES